MGIGYDLRKHYDTIKERQDIEKILVEGDEALPQNADSLSKQVLIKKIMVMTKFSKQFLIKMDEEALRTIYKTFMAMGKARVVKDLRGEPAEEAE